MEDLVRSLIEHSRINGRFDEERFIIEQSHLPFADRTAVRYSEELTKMFFELDAWDGAATDYCFWDNTTLCMKFPLLEYVRDGMRVLEIGPGPTATMSVFLAKAKADLQITAAELNPRFIVTATKNAAANAVRNLTIIQSDMTKSVHSERFDVVFMNPPYVREQVLAQLGIDKDSGAGVAGNGAADGCRVVDQFLEEVPRILKADGLALLGINNLHLDDATVREHIGRSRVRLKRNFYDADRLPPKGPFSQVYVLAH
jgi:methylase of polypeptide subunit release factors